MYYMIKIKYSNIPIGANRFTFTLRYVYNIVRTAYYFKIKYPWVKYNGFVRVMKNTTFTKSQIILGKNVQFGPYCNISTNVSFGNHILLAGRVCIIGRNDHSFDTPGQLIWDGKRGVEETTNIQDDVWIGHNCTVLAGVTIEKGSIVAAGSLVNKNVPACEIWGGVPAKKIRDRFKNEECKLKHLRYLHSLK